MNAKRKIALCRSLGITPWVARKPLLGAAAHHIFALKDRATGLPQASADTAAVLDQRKMPNKNRAAELAQSLENTTAQSIATTNAKVKTNGPITVVPSQEQAFTLVAVVSGNILLLDDISGLQLTTSAYTQWLNALLFAMGAPPLDMPLAAQHRFSWPLAQHAQQFSAAEMVNAWLKKKLSGHAKTNAEQRILVMGKKSTELLATASALGEQTTVPSLYELPALVTLGSSQLWSQPSLKRIFWQHLQSFHR